MGWLSLLFVAWLTGFLILIYRDFSYWRRRGVPCVATFPIIGVFAPVFMRKQSLIHMIQDYYHSCPGARYLGCLDFSNPVIIVKDPEIVKEIGIKSFDHFPNHRSFVEDEFDPLLARNIFSLKDDHWRAMRAILSPSFTGNKMKFLFQLVSKCSVDFVTHLKDHPEITNDLDLKDAVTRYTNDVIASAGFGISVNSMENPDNEFYLNALDASTFDGLFKVMKFLNARMWPRFVRMMGLSFLSKRAENFFKTVIYETVRIREEKGIVRPDMIHLLLQARNNENGVEMTTDDIIAQALIFILAGFETSSRLMCFMSHVLSHHPDIQERLREEVDSALDQDGGNITYETLTKMKYMDMVVSETLRLYPPMPMTDRICNKPYTLPRALDSYNEFTVQPNTAVWFPVYSFHHDPDYFPDPETFDPERFSDENKKFIKPYTYLPFGIGPRKCIGDRFALMETKILVTHLLQNFILKPSPKTTKEIVYDHTTFNMMPDCGFWLQLEKRE